MYDLTAQNRLSYPPLMARITGLLALLLSLSFFFSSTAQAEETTQYNIEVIVFENFALKSWTEEYWPELVEAPSSANSTPFAVKGQTPLWIGKASMNLKDVANRMVNSKGYRILFHQAWSQNAPDTNKAPSVYIDNLGQSGTQLAGTVKLYKTRFAHVDVNLQIDKIIPSKIRGTFTANQKLTYGEQPSRWRFNLQESRKVKTGELHYIDHPLFGVLVQVSPRN